MAPPRVGSGQARGKKDTSDGSPSLRRSLVIGLWPISKCSSADVDSSALAECAAGVAKRK